MFNKFSLNLRVTLFKGLIFILIIAVRLELKCDLF